MQITKDDKKIIYYSRKSVPFEKGYKWMKKGGDLFDVAIGAYGDA